MDRRKFFKLLGMGVAGVALDQAIPFNRVWSFPSNIVVPNRLLTTEWVTMESLLILKQSLLRLEKQVHSELIRYELDEDLVLVSSIFSCSGSLTR
jgi:hypothetical protein